MLAELGVGGAVGVTGALIGLEIPEYEAKRYEGRKKEEFFSRSIATIPLGQTRQGNSGTHRCGRYFHNGRIGGGFCGQRQAIASQRRWRSYLTGGV